jgi:hypothetical protein
VMGEPVTVILGLGEIEIENEPADAGVYMKVFGEEVPVHDRVDGVNVPPPPPSDIVMVLVNVVLLGVTVKSVLGCSELYSTRKQVMPCKSTAIP